MSLWRFGSAWLGPVSPSPRHRLSSRQAKHSGRFPLLCSERRVLPTCRDRDHPPRDTFGPRSPLKGEGLFFFVGFCVRFSLRQCPYHGGCGPGGMRRAGRPGCAARTADHVASVRESAPAVPLGGFPLPDGHRRALRGVPRARAGRKLFAGHRLSSSAAGRMQGGFAAVCNGCALQCNASGLLGHFK